MRKIFLASGAITLVWLQVAVSQPVQAHIGGGPPFLSVNGKDAPTNPNYIQSTQNFTVEQDLPPDHYLVNKPIHFAIKLNQLPVPPDVAAHSTFRWTWDTDSKNNDYGNTVDHTYTSIGSHIMTLEVKGPGEADYLVYDTALIDVVPSLGYKTPRVNVAVVKDSFGATKPVHFVAQSQVDPSAKIKQITWDFGPEEGISHETAPTHAYKDKDYLHFVYVELIDSNGFKVVNGITMTANAGALTISPLSASGPAVPLVDATSVNGGGKTTSTNGSMVWLIIGGVVVLAIITVTAYGISQRKASATNKYQRIR